MSTPKSPLITIERSVAFAVGPLVAAGAGWLSTFLAAKLGINESAEAIVGVYVVGQGGAFYLANKWLGGRQAAYLLKIEHEAASLGHVAAALGIGAPAQHAAAGDLMKLLETTADDAVRAAANKIAATSHAEGVAAARAASDALRAPADATAPSGEVVATPPPAAMAPIAPAQDPAPPGTPVVGTSGDGTQAAGAGAAPGQ
jgi:hypothetical protein